MQEISRLREITIRPAGEGTGKAIDVDYYDNYNLRLFVWNTKTNDILGAYRRWQSDVMIENFGIRTFTAILCSIIHSS